MELFIFKTLPVLEISKTSDHYIILFKKPVNKLQLPTRHYRDKYHDTFILKP